MPALDDLTSVIVAGLPDDTTKLAARTEKVIDGLFRRALPGDLPRHRRVVLMCVNQLGH